MRSIGFDPHSCMCLNFLPQKKKGGLDLETKKYNFLNEINLKKSMIHIDGEHETIM